MEIKPDFNHNPGFYQFSNHNLHNTDEMID